MARQCWAQVLTYTDATTGALKAAGETEVFVYLGGTTTLATIYSARSGGSPASNPFVVGSSGLALFWTGVGDFDIKFHDTKLPARFGDYTIGWQSAPVNVEIDAGELANTGDLEWVQEGGGGWKATLKDGVVDLAALQNSAFIPSTLFTAATQQALFTSGDIKASARSAAPTGWLLCNGESLLRAEYASLFAAIGTSYGSADGTHFNIPNAFGRGLLGAGTGAGLTARALGASGGEENHLLTIAELAAHQHYVNINSNEVGAHTHGLNAAASYGGGGGIAITGEGGNRTTSAAGNHSHNSQGYSNSEGGGGAHNNMPPFVAANFLIKT